MNQQGTISGLCSSGQNGRGGLFYVVEDNDLFQSVTNPINGATAPTLLLETFRAVSAKSVTLLTNVAQCRTANQDGPMPKNIVICCDGTANEFTQHNTNVVKLCYALDQEPTQQVTYYHPGLGTMEPAGALTPLARKFTKV